MSKNKVEPSLMMAIKVTERLKKARSSMTQEEFAKKIGIPYSTYFQYEQGFKIGVKHIDKIRALLGLTAEEALSILKK